MLRTAIEQAGALLTRSVNNRVYVQQVRTTIVVRRMYPPRLWKDTEIKKIKKQERVYIVEDNTAACPAGNMKVLLTQDIDGVGGQGEVVTVQKAIARNKLLPLGIAVYNSPENQQRYCTNKKDHELVNFTTQKTLRQLEGMTLPVPMNLSVEWTLTAHHVRLAFRKAGVIVPEEAITLPEEPITGPGEFTVEVLVNGKYTTQVKSLVYGFLKDDPEPPKFRIFSKTKRSLSDVLADIIQQEGKSGETGVVDGVRS